MMHSICFGRAWPIDQVSEHHVKDRVNIGTALTYHTVKRVTKTYYRSRLSSVFHPWDYWDHHAYRTKYQRMPLFVGVTIQTMYGCGQEHDKPCNALCLFVRDDEKANLCTCRSCIYAQRNTTPYHLGIAYMFVKRNCAPRTDTVKHKNFKIGHLFFCLTALYNVA